MDVLRVCHDGDDRLFYQHAILPDEQTVKAHRIDRCSDITVYRFAIHRYVHLRGCSFLKAFGFLLPMAWGFVNDNPYIAMLSSAITFVVFGALSYLLIRKAQVKDN